MERRQIRADEASKVVRDAWASVLGLAEFDDDDDFFALGGHSLLVVEVVDAVARDTGVTIPVRDFFARPFVPALAGIVVRSSSNKSG